MYWYQKLLVVVTIAALLSGTAGAQPAGLTGREAYFLTPINGKAPATDSASAATAMATGWKTDDGNIAWKPGDPAGGGVETLAEYVHRAPRNFAVGVASTVPFSHATPAAFLSHNVSRNNFSAIANEIILSTQPEVIIGGGHPLYVSTSPDYKYVGGQTLWNNLLAHNTAYTQVVTRQSGVSGAAALRNAAAAMNLIAGDKLAGVFGGTGGNFDYHQAADAPGAPAILQGSTENPTLSDVTTSTLKILSQDPDGFFALFEQGDIDWSNHENNYKNMVGGVWDLERAVKTAQAFIDQPGGPEWSNTLVIVTADHSNSYMRLHAPLGKGDLPEQQWVDLNGNSKVEGGEWYYPDGEVTYRLSGHTNELVMLYARGAGAAHFSDLAGTWYPGTNIIDNTQIYQALKDTIDNHSANHIILFIGDGMNIHHEIAGSRYLYGSDFGLTWDAWDSLTDGVRLPVATWDVTTYNQYAGGPAWMTPSGPVSLGSNTASLGYDVSKGGDMPYPTVPGAITLSAGPALAFSLRPYQMAQQTVSMTKTGDVNLAWNLSESPAAGWVSAAPTAGYLIYDGQASMPVSIDTAGMQPGVYTTTLTIANSYQDVSVPVTLTVTSATSIFLPVARK
jgi:alkaline phosphatase